MKSVVEEKKEETFKEVDEPAGQRGVLTWTSCLQNTSAHLCLFLSTESVDAREIHQSTTLTMLTSFHNTFHTRF
ncbi:unnamed protein product [Taenia asiatica]|uniref:Uncharacterized protein n=1 Tax=Taenia asiatica TaxID=60517 RepID=A0A0R3WDQ9_TAEAS|nr:unnamed protein product [Taenia asiatica]